MRRSTGLKKPRTANTDTSGPLASGVRPSPESCARARACPADICALAFASRPDLPPLPAIAPWPWAHARIRALPSRPHTRPALTPAYAPCPHARIRALPSRPHTRPALTPAHARCPRVGIRAPVVPYRRHPPLGIRPSRPHPRSEVRRLRVGPMHADAPPRRTNNSVLQAPGTTNHPCVAQGRRVTPYGGDPRPRRRGPVQPAIARQTAANHSVGHATARIES
jgi:hypothetical protein